MKKLISYLIIVIIIRSIYDLNNGLGFSILACITLYIYFHVADKPRNND